jgi:hypothetical protein
VRKERTQRRAGGSRLNRKGTHGFEQVRCQSLSVSLDILTVYIYTLLPQVVVRLGDVKLALVHVDEAEAARKLFGGRVGEGRGWDLDVGQSVLSAVDCPVGHMGICHDRERVATRDGRRESRRDQNESSIRAKSIRFS